MRQKELTKEQKELCEKLNELFSEAREKGIDFVFDYSDGTVTAFNSEGVENCSIRGYESEIEEPIDWEKCYVIDSGTMYSFASDMEQFMLYF